MAFNFGTKSAFGPTSATTTTATTFGGFGAAAKPATAGFGFGTTTTSAGTGLFGTGATQSSGGTFELRLPVTTTSGFTFGTQSASTNTGFKGFGTGASTAGSTDFGFGTGASTFGTGLGTQATQQATVQNALANMVSAVTAPVVYGDERDMVIAKWNQIQAFWGVGKGYYTHQHHVEFSKDNPFSRFKAVGYSRMPDYKNEDGLAQFLFAKKENEVKPAQQQIVDCLHKLIGSKPSLSVCVESVREIPDNKTEMLIYIMERMPNGSTRRLPSTEVQNFFSQNHIKTPLKQLHIESVVAKVRPSPDQLKQYLDSPPSGIDPLLWQQAKSDNPDPDTLIPVPMIGFSDLNNRLKLQEQQSKLHQASLTNIGDDISSLQRNHATVIANIEQLKRKHSELGHRVLKVIAKQEIYRKLGYAIQGDEEQLRAHLEATQVELNAPTQFKGRLNELMSQIRMQNQLSGGHAELNYQLDPQMNMEIKQHLKQQQEGLQHLLTIIKDDMEDLQLIEQGLEQSTRK